MQFKKSRFNPPSFGTLQLRSSIAYHDPLKNNPEFDTKDEGAVELKRREE
jgi:hypothetical protein